ncbi:mitochondrial branched-chain alpha-ketoacid dehydrogenase kinase-domain-containing protein [Flagelloscypha sp. PMI_526]|nr:mitochondrial branched-chain alpha-ketoacid dehydrogenase kinase-domain-containing protein [Flagelloscypha sp. PMI_526]
MSFRISHALWDKIHHFASFPQTGVSLQQMVLFGQNPSQGTLLKASQFLAEELPVRLAHRLPHGLSEMPSIVKVKNWYAQSFDELIHFPPIELPPDIRKALATPQSKPQNFPEASPNPSLNLLMDEMAWSRNREGQNGYSPFLLRLRVPMERRYYAATSLKVFPPEIYEYNNKFTKLITQIKTRHDPTVTTVASGILEYKRHHRTQSIGLEVQGWLDRFYMSRIGIRFLIGQHIALNNSPPHPSFVGIIDTAANVHEIVSEGIENARFVCEEHYGMFRAPSVQLICPKELNFPYVPGHLSHIIFELLKNSLRAVVERFGKDYEDNNVDHYPPIKVIVVEGKEDITIKISDEGGGIARSAIPLIWTYMYTTMEQSLLEGEESEPNDFKAPLAGFGYGLPLSRLYARYFGGDLRLISMDGFGTDVYIHLNRLSSSREPLL